MLPLPPFSLHEPETLAEARALISSLGPEARLVAGGTDLLPAMKLGLAAPAHLVSLRRVRELDGLDRRGEHLRIGAMTSLEQIAEDPELRVFARALVEAAGAVGGPHHRRMGTLGGNLCLDTRCRYVDQSEFWRSALGYCLKKGGSVCHVVPKGRNCVAAASNDTAAAALALGAEVAIVSAGGERALPVSDLYTADGVKNTTLCQGEIVSALAVPRRPRRTSAYEKLRRRGAIDFPLLSIAVCADRDEDDRISSLRVVVSALAAKPRQIVRADAMARGLAPAEVPVGEIADVARSECNPLPSIDPDVVWRKEMVAVLVHRALVRAGLGASR